MAAVFRFHKVKKEAVVLCQIQFLCEPSLQVSRGSSFGAGLQDCLSSRSRCVETKESRHSARHVPG